VQPDILIMDEMISAGDQRFVEKAEQRVKEMIAKASILVLASHSDELILELCNKAILVEQGRIVAMDTPDVVLGRYRNGHVRRDASAKRQKAKADKKL
jgi:ABC-type polysaccharide/polyol phosphate transport system ATPase subunit